MKSAVAIRRDSVSATCGRCREEEALLDGTTTALVRLGWSVVSATERDVDVGRRLPGADVYLSMVRGTAATCRLLELEGRGLRFVNRPSSVLACRRATSVTHFRDSDVPFVPTLVLERDQDPDSATAWLARRAEGGVTAWVKRGDDHGAGPEDAVRVGRAVVPHVIAHMRSRGVRTVVVQPHLTGPSARVYGVANGWAFVDGDPSLAEGSVAAIRSAACAAAARLGLEVFGCDAVVVAPGRCCIVEVFDWPSFGRVRREGADAIAAHVHAGASAVEEPVTIRTPPPALFG